MDRFIKFLRPFFVFDSVKKSREFYRLFILAFSASEFIPSECLLKRYEEARIHCIYEVLFSDEDGVKEM